MKVCIVGCGLVGSMLASPLAALAMSLGVDTRVTLIDHDVVEKRNSPANLSVPTTIGMPKVTVVGDIFARCKISTNRIQQKLTKGNLWMLDGADLIIGAVDDIKTRRLILEASSTIDVPYMDLGINDLSGLVSWSIGGVSNMQYATEALELDMPDKEKQPPCTLVATRIMSSMVTECAAKSVFIYTSGHDPMYTVSEVLNREAKGGDMISWHVVLGGGAIKATPFFVGNADKGEAE